MNNKSIIYLQPTSPLRNYLHINKAIKMHFKNNHKAVISFRKSDNKIITIPRGIDINYFNPKSLNMKTRNIYRNKLGVLKSQILIIIPSRFSNWKGHLQLIIFLKNQPKSVLKRIKLLMFLNNDDENKKKKYS